MVKLKLNKLYLIVILQLSIYCAIVNIYEHQSFTSRVGSYASLFRNISFLILYSAAALYSPFCLKHSPPIPSHLSLVSPHMPDPALLTTTKAVVLNQFLGAKLATRHEIIQMSDSVTQCDVTELKAGLLVRRFRSGVFCGREELFNF